MLAPVGLEALLRSCFLLFGIVLLTSTCAFAQNGNQPAAQEARFWEWASLISSDNDQQTPGILGGGKNKAHRLAEQIGRINPSKGYLAEAQLVHMEKRTSELEALYLKAVEADPTSFDALAALAGFYGSQGQQKNMELA